MWREDGLTLRDAEGFRVYGDLRHFPNPTKIKSLDNALITPVEDDILTKLDAVLKKNNPNIVLAYGINYPKVSGSTEFFWKNLYAQSNDADGFLGKQSKFYCGK